MEEEMNIDVRQVVHPDHGKRMDTSDLRENFLVESIFEPGTQRFTYSFFDRIAFGGIVPTTKALALEPSDVLATEYFLERREIGLINLGGPGLAEVDGKRYELGKRDGMYIGMGVRDVLFSSADATDPARLYCVSTGAHHGYPTVHIPSGNAKAVHLGSKAESNKRTIYQYVHPSILSSCQLAMGLTVLEPENVWNTMPCHTHGRRMEVYFYLDTPEDALVFHLMGPPE
jgi:4-deoxy-L-threo-5-hexosulose-uronate ketol-isomerase